MAKRDIGGAIVMRNSGLSEEDADALFLTQAEADALFLTPAEGDAAYKTLEAVIAPTLLNSWVNEDASREQAGYWKEPNGKIVHIRGNLKNGTLGTAAYTLPSGYFDPSIAISRATVANEAIARIFISSAGAVQPQTGSNAWFVCTTSFRIP